MPYNFSYDKLLLLDAEKLAEGGIRRAYDRLLPTLRRFVRHPARVIETIDDDAPSYSVRCNGQDYVIYDANYAEEGAANWGRATVAFFDIVNGQSANADSGYRLYAINGANDLGGMFLTPEHAKAARETLSNRTDWPYIPKDEPPWYGQYH